mmetsp:Transcript_117737/g.333718  ORF Transcript_117737/g.333718 Transcript_117737/m.333718 type:complete len:260 (+) Transcript_117737:1119-1898(+)
MRRSLDLRVPPAESDKSSCFLRVCGAEELERDEHVLLILEHSASAAWPSLLAREEDPWLGRRWLPPLWTHKLRRVASVSAGTPSALAVVVVCPTPSACEACGLVSLGAPFVLTLASAPWSSGAGAPEPLEARCWFPRRCSSSDEWPPSLSDAVCGLRTKGVSGSSIFWRVPRSLSCSAMACSSQWTRPLFVFRGLVLSFVHLEPSMLSATTVVSAGSMATVPSHDILPLQPSGHHHLVRQGGPRRHKLTTLQCEKDTMT